MNEDELINSLQEALLGQETLNNLLTTIVNGSMQKALKMALDYGSIDGADHKMWAIDQIVRILAGDNYDKVIEEHKQGEDGPDTYGWDTGIAP